MAAKRLSMRKIKGVLRLGAQGLSDREIGRSLKIPRTTVRRYRARAEEAGVAWPLPEELTESALEAQLFPPAPPVGQHVRPEPDWAYIHKELRRPGVARTTRRMSAPSGAPLAGHSPMRTRTTRTS